jgi:hypothetical protein
LDPQTPIQENPDRAVNRTEFLNFLTGAKGADRRPEKEEVQDEQDNLRIDQNPPNDEPFDLIRAWFSILNRAEFPNTKRRRQKQPLSTLIRQD